jgi:hypothetical protein
MKMSKRNWPRINRRNNHVKALIRPTPIITCPHEPLLMSIPSAPGLVNDVVGRFTNEHRQMQ